MDARDKRGHDESNNSRFNLALPLSSAVPAATAEQPATSRAQTDAVAAQAVSGTPFVRDVLAAKPIGVLLAGGALLWRALCSRRCRSRNQYEAKQAASHRQVRQNRLHRAIPLQGLTKSPHRVLWVKPPIYRRIAAAQS